MFVTPHCSGKTRVDLFPVNAAGCTLVVELKDGENTVTAKCAGCCCGVEDTAVFNGVAEHNDAYTLPDIAAAMAVGNWFDEVSDNDDPCCHDHDVRCTALPALP